MAALVTIGVHNLVDDLYDHGLTNLMALLVIALIALGRVTSRVVPESLQISPAPDDETPKAPAPTPELVELTTPAD
jgi:hypothetical protein